jgi:hypothetical protein
MRDLVPALADRLRKGMKWVDRSYFSLYPDHVQTLMARYRHEPGFLSKYMESSERENRELYGFSDALDGDDHNDLFIFIRTHYLFVQNMMSWALVSIPLLAPSGMLSCFHFEKNCIRQVLGLNALCSFTNGRHNLDMFVFSCSLQYVPHVRLFPMQVGKFFTVVTA